MPKCKLKPSTEESFAIGKLVGAKEALEEIKELIVKGESLKIVQIYIGARLKTLHTCTINNPFKQKDRG